MAGIPEAVLVKPTDAIIRIRATDVCGSHLWHRVAEPTFLHCLTGGARRLDHIWRGFASSNLAISQRELDQAASDQQIAKSNLRAALPARGAYPSPLRRGHSPTTRLRGATDSCKSKLAIEWRKSSQLLIA
jgi:hypothetical protein